MVATYIKILMQLADLISGGEAVPTQDLGGMQVCANTILMDASRTAAILNIFWDSYSFRRATLRAICQFTLREHLLTVRASWPFR